MEVLRIDDLCRNGVVGRVQAHSGSGLRMARRRVAGLNHEVEDDAVPEVSVVEALVHQFQEVVAMLRRLVVEHHANVSHRSLQQHFRLRQRVAIGLGKRTQTNGPHQ